jgi:hypothetical protein
MEPSREGNFFKTWAGYYIAKPEWRESYWIALDCSPDGSEIYIGITWESHNLRKQARIELLTALQTIYPSARFGSRSVYEMVRSPADWSKPDVLWRMHKDPAEFVTDLANHLLATAGVSEPIIDRLVRNK